MKRQRASPKRPAPRDLYRLLFERNLAGVFRVTPAGRVLVCNNAFGRMFGYASAEELLSEQPFERHSGTPAWTAFLARLREQGTVPGLEASAVRKDGSRVWLVAHVGWVEEPGGPVLEGTAIDVTERKRADESRSASLLAQASLVKASASLLSTLDPNAVLTQVLQTALEAVPAAEKGTILSWNEAARSLKVSTTLGYRDPRVRELSFPVTTGYAAQVAVTRKPLVVADSRADPQIRYDGEIAEIRQVRSALVAPLLARGELLGVISLDATRPGAFTDGDVALIVAFADQAALAIHNARLYESVRASEERFAKAFTASPAAITISTLEGGAYLDANAAFLELIGRGRDEIVGQASVRLGLWVDPADRARMASALVSNGTVRGMASRFFHASGEVRDVLISAELIDLEGQQCVLALSQDVTEQKRAGDQIARLAYYDALTDLPNRVLFKDRLEQAMARVQREQRTLALLFLDLDHFKLVNDTLGHTAGDQVLQEVARRLRTCCLRKEDTVSRVAGDEFTLLLNGILGVEGAGRFAQRLLESVSGPSLLDGHEIFVTASIGIALYPEDGDDGDTLLRSADGAMYRAKALGGNNYQLCTPDTNTRAAERLGLENHLRRAVDRRELVLHYQPVVEVVTGRVVGAEALLRWQHPERGLLQPDAFIPLAEESRLIIPMGEWALRAACRQLREWRASGLPPLRMAVNLSARQFQEEGLAAVVQEILDETGIPPELLELEITESVAMQRLEWTAGVLAALRKTGVRISLDDFGTGQSSLGYLKHFPLNTVKIDRSFLRDLFGDRGNEAIVRAVITLAHSLKLGVIAEGVESEEQLAFLRAALCEEFQGFVFSRALPAPLFEALLRRSPGVAAQTPGEG